MTYSASLGDFHFTGKKKKKELSKQEDKLKQRQKGEKGKGDNDISRQSPEQMPVNSQSNPIRKRLLLRANKMALFLHLL